MLHRHYVVMEYFDAFMSLERYKNTLCITRTFYMLMMKLYKINADVKPCLLAQVSALSTGLSGIVFFKSTNYSSCVHITIKTIIVLECSDSINFT